MSMSSLEPYGYGGLAGKADEERWHVRLAADDVKVMTVEQLDDAFRLSIVDGDTEVWKTGMRGWQPLSVVARLDSDSIVGMEPEVTKVGPSPHDATPRAPLDSERTPLRAVPSPRGSAPPPARSIPPPPKLVVVRPPDPVRPPAPAPRYSPPPTLPRAAEPVTLPPVSRPVPSVVPVARSVPPPARSSGRFGNGLLVLAFLSGTVLSLYRNDVLLDWAKRAHVEGKYLSLEARFLGGPPRETPRALAAAGSVGIAKAETSDRSLASAAPAAPVTAPRREEAPASAAPAKAVRPETGGPAAAATSLDSLPRDAAPTATERRTPSASKTPAPAPRAEASPARAVSRPATARPAARHEAPPVSAPRPRKHESAASEYDPLNPAL